MAKRMGADFAEQPCSMRSPLSARSATNALFRRPSKVSGHAARRRRTASSSGTVGSVFGAFMARPRIGVSLEEAGLDTPSEERPQAPVMLVGADPLEPSLQPGEILLDHE